MNDTQAAFLRATTKELEAIHAKVEHDLANTKNSLAQVKQITGEGQEASS